jgi:hypothetical protein
MRHFMTSGYLTWGAELDKGPDRSDMTPFLEENIIMMVYGGRPLSGRRRVSNLSLKAPTCCGLGHGAQGCNNKSFPASLYIYTYPLYIYILKCILQPFQGAKIRKRERKQKGDGTDDPKPRAWQPSQAQSQGLTLEASASCRCFRMRSAAGKTTGADFGSWGMS